MGYSNFEFPHTDFYNSDLRELIAMYAKLSKEYAQLLADIEYCKNAVDNINESFDLVNKRIDTVEKAMVVLKQEITSAVEIELRHYEDNMDLKLGEVINQTISVDNKLTKQMQELSDNVKWQIANLKDYVAKQIRYAETYTDNMSDRLKIYIDNQDNKLIDIINNIKIDQSELISPVDGIQKSTQDVVDDVYNAVIMWTLTAYEYDCVELTAEEYDKLDVTAWDYDTLSKWYCKEKVDVLKKAENLLINTKKEISNIKTEFVRRTEGYSPFSGLVKGVTDLFYEMAMYLRNSGLESSEYDSLELTAQEYDDEEMSAYNYDWYGRIILLTGTQPITAESYDNLLITANQYGSYRMTASDYDLYAGTILRSAM